MSQMGVKLEKIKMDYDQVTWKSSANLFQVGIKW